MFIVRFVEDNYEDADIYEANKESLTHHHQNKTPTPLTKRKP